MNTPPHRKPSKIRFWLLVEDKERAENRNQAKAILEGYSILLTPCATVVFQPLHLPEDSPNFMIIGQRFAGALVEENTTVNNEKTAFHS